MQAHNNTDRKKDVTSFLLFANKNLRFFHIIQEYTCLYLRRRHANDCGGCGRLVMAVSTLTFVVSRANNWRSEIGRCLVNLLRESLFFLHNDQNLVSRHASMTIFCSALATFVAILTIIFKNTSMGT